MFYRLITLAFALTLPLSASAQINWPWIEQGANIPDLFIGLGNILLPMGAIIALTVIAVSAGAMIFSQSESQGDTARRALISASVGLGLLAITAPFATSFAQDGLLIILTELPAEVLGVAGFIRVIVGVVAVLMIIISGIRAIFAFGSDEGVTQLRRTVISTAIAIALLSKNISEGIASAFTQTGRPDSLISAFGSFTKLLLSFVGIAAVVAVVYAGILMIVNIGNDEQYQRARSLLVRVLLGLIVIAASWALLSLIVTGVGS